MASSSPSLSFTVHKCPPELVAPAIRTPDETKLLSDIDDQEYLRSHYSIIQIYRNESSMANKDPVRVIRQALAQALVSYYPFAGRLREGRGSKLMVDCTGEGVMFVEADADVTLDQFGDALQPPFEYSQKFHCEFPDTQDPATVPLLLIQVLLYNYSQFTYAHAAVRFRKQSHKSMASRITDRLIQKIYLIMVKFNFYT